MKNLFKRDILQNDESVLYQSRQDPNIAFAGPGFLFFLTLLAIMTSPLLTTFGAFILFVSWLKWRKHIYVLTNKRALLLTGVLNRSITDIPYTKIQNLSVKTFFGYGQTGQLIFDTAGTTFKEMVWDNIKNVQDIYKTVSAQLDK